MLSLRKAQVDQPAVNNSSSPGHVVSDSLPQPYRGLGVVLKLTQPHAPGLARKGCGS